MSDLALPHLGVTATPPPPVVQTGATMAVGPWNAGPDQEVTEYSSGQMTYTLDEGHQLSFTMPGHSAAALLTDGLVSDVWVWIGGELLGRFRVLPVEQSWGASGEDDVTINAVNYKRLLSWRYLHSPPPTFTQVEQGEIIWALIAHTQGQVGGDLGITKGDVATGVVRDRTEYKVGDNIYDLGGNLSRVENGCWWDIDAERVLHARLYDDFEAIAQPIELGTNALTLKRTPGSTFANAVMASGDQEATTPVWVQQKGIGIDPRGRWESTVSSSSMTVQNSVRQLARGELRRTIQPPASWTASIVPQRWLLDSAYRPGEIATVVIPPSVVDPISDPRDADTVDGTVTETAVTFDADGALTVQTTISEGRIVPDAEETS